MAKKKDEKDVLVVRDEKTGEISVVAGLNADGTPKRTPAKAENAQIATSKKSFVSLMILSTSPDLFASK